MPSPDCHATTSAHPGRQGWRSRLALGLGAAALTAALITTVLLSGRDDALQSRQADVRDRGATVMPFDLDRTEHVFTDMSDGGEQTVTALDPADTSQILLIRGHLQEEAEKFRAGDFEDPAAIHGDDMPGLTELRDGAIDGRITVTYSELEDGARLRYSATDPNLVDGIHSWFEAQQMEHG